MLAAEKYSRFLQPPLSVSAGHDCDGKPKTKPDKKTSSVAGLALSAIQKATLHYTSLCAHRVWTIGRFVHDASLFST